MNTQTSIKFTDDHEAVIGIGSADGVASVSFSGVDNLRWIQITPDKMRELADAFKDAADTVEATA
jgi:hypothetical protein